MTETSCDLLLRRHVKLGERDPMNGRIIGDVEDKWPGWVDEELRMIIDPKYGVFSPTRPPGTGAGWNITIQEFKLIAHHRFKCDEYAIRFYEVLVSLKNNNAPLTIECEAFETVCVSIDHHFMSRVVFDLDRNLDKIIQHDDLFDKDRLIIEKGIDNDLVHVVSI
jgi:hypothetical protein